MIPRCHYLKLLTLLTGFANCDGAIFPDVNCARLGVVIKYFEGMVIAALSERVPLPPLVDDLEALACRKSITLALEIRLQDVIFEGDSEVVFKHITTDSTILSYADRKRHV